MCQTCYNKGYTDYPNYDSKVDHIEEYKKGYRTKQNESLGAEELQHTFFCEKCYARGLSNSSNGLWAPPMSTKRGHYESYEKGYNHVEVAESEKIPEYYLPDNEREKLKHKPKPKPIVNATPKQAPPLQNGSSNTALKIGIGVIIGIAIAFIFFRFISNPTNPSAPDSNGQPTLVPDTAIKPIVVKDTMMSQPQKDTTQIRVTDTTHQKNNNITQTLGTKPATNNEAESKKPTIPIATNQQKSGNEKANSTKPGGKFPRASEVLLTEYDLKGMSKEDMKMMRNEIFARHGYIFKSPAMNAYFERQGWYKGQFMDVNDKLSTLERENVIFIKNHEL